MNHDTAISTPRLAQLVGGRVTHDMAGPLGTLMAASGAGGGERSDELLFETLAELRLRLRLYAALFGEPEAMGWEDVQALLAGSPAAHRVALRFETPPQAALPAGHGQLALAAAMVASEALPRGGQVRIAALSAGGQGGMTVSVMPQGRAAAWPHSLLERLAGMPPAEPDTPRALMVPWMLSLAGLVHCRVSIGMGGVPAASGEEPRLPPLLLGPLG